MTPDFTRLVTVGMEIQLDLSSNVEATQSRGASAGDAPIPFGGDPPLPIESKGAHRMIVFDLPTKQTELYALLFTLRHPITTLL